MHSIRRCVIAAILVLGGIATAAQAQDYPTRPVRFISDSAPGSAIDVTMRVIVDGISRVWGGNAVLINQPGAGGAIGVRAVSTAAPDGYTFGMFALSDFVTLPGTADNLPVQVPHDFTPVGSLGGAPMFITAAPWLEVKTLPELIALRQAAAGRACLRHQRAGPAHPSHRRIAAKPRRHKAPDGALFGRHAAGAQRHDGQEGRARLRFLFGHRRCGGSEKRHSARGRGAQAHDHVSRPADGRRDAARISVRGLADAGGAGRHA